MGKTTASRVTESAAPAAAKRKPRSPGNATAGDQPRRRHSPEVRRALIIEAAKECIADSGLARTTAREVAARCDISTGTLTHHFASMDELLVEALRSGSKELTDRNLSKLETAPTALDGLHLLIETALPDKPEALRNWRLWLEYWARAAHEPSLAAVQLERYREWRGAFERVIERGIASGEFAPVDSASSARELVGLFDGLCIEAVVGGQVSVREAREILVAWVASHLHPA